MTAVGGIWHWLESFEVARVHWVYRHPLLALALPAVAVAAVWLWNKYLSD